MCVCQYNIRCSYRYSRERTTKIFSHNKNIYFVNTLRCCVWVSPLAIIRQFLVCRKIEYFNYTWEKKVLFIGSHSSTLSISWDFPDYLITFISHTSDTMSCSCLYCNNSFSLLLLWANDVTYLYLTRNRVLANIFLCEAWCVDERSKKCALRLQLNKLFYVRHSMCVCT